MVLGNTNKLKDVPRDISIKVKILDKWYPVRKYNLLGKSLQFETQDLSGVAPYSDWEMSRL